MRFGRANVQVEPTAPAKKTLHWTIGILDSDMERSKYVADSQEQANNCRI